MKHNSRCELVFSLLAATSSLPSVRLQPTANDLVIGDITSITSEQKKKRTAMRTLSNFANLLLCSLGER
jgi:hypothetical protein